MPLADVACPSAHFLTDSFYCYTTPISSRQCAYTTAHEYRPWLTLLVIGGRHLPNWHKRRTVISSVGSFYISNVHKDNRCRYSMTKITCKQLTVQAIREAHIRRRLDIVCRKTVIQECQAQWTLSNVHDYSCWGKSTPDVDWAMWVVTTNTVFNDWCSCPWPLSSCQCR